MLRYIWLLPLFTFLIVPFSFFFSYLWAVEDGHVGALFPSISETITFAPESCVFGQLLNIGAVLVGLCIYLRHRQIIEFYETVGKEGRGWKIASTVFLWIGLCSAFGISIVANFQATRYLKVHGIGALMAFVGGLLYGWVQTIFSYAMKPRFSSVVLAHIRLVFTILGTVFFFTMTGAGVANRAIKKEHNNSTSTEKPFFVNPSDPKYPYILLSDFSEWLMAICFMLFILSFAIELRHAALVPPKLILTGRIAERAEELQRTLRNTEHTNFAKF